MIEVCMATSMPWWWLGEERQSAVDKRSESEGLNMEKPVTYGDTCRVRMNPGTER